MIKLGTLINRDNIMEGIPELESLQMADALLFAVYKWKPEKIKK